MAMFILGAPFLKWTLLELAKLVGATGGTRGQARRACQFPSQHQRVHSLRKLVERGLTVGGENATPSGVPATGGYGEANQREMAPRRGGGVPSRAALRR